MDDLKPLLTTVAQGQSLSREDARRAFSILMSGEATDAQIGAFLMALRVRGETVEEIAAGAETMREKALKIDAPEDAIDTCGTGGDASGTFNISTAVSLVVAACGVPVAKHGNRALSSRSGAADVLKTPRRQCRGGTGSGRRLHPGGGRRLSFRAPPSQRHGHVGPRAL